jgi:hypothetical protein
METSGNNFELVEIETSNLLEIQPQLGTSTEQINIEPLKGPPYSPIIIKRISDDGIAQYKEAQWK